MYISLNEMGLGLLVSTDEEVDLIKPFNDLEVKAIPYKNQQGFGLYTLVNGERIPNVFIKDSLVNGERIPNVFIKDSLIIETLKKYVIALNSITPDLSSISIITDDQESWTERVSLAEGSQFSEAGILREIIMYLIKKKKIKV